MLSAAMETNSNDQLDQRDYLIVFCQFCYSFLLHEQPCDHLGLFLYDAFFKHADVGFKIFSCDLSADQDSQLLHQQVLGSHHGWSVMKGFLG
jgi:hypothetical protein